MGGGPPEGRGPRRGPRPALRTEAAPDAGCAPGCSGGTGVQEAAGETGVFTGPGDRLLWAVRGPSALSPRSPAPCLPGARPRTWACLPVVRGLLGALGLPAGLSVWIPRAVSPGPPCGAVQHTRAPCACRCPSVQGRPGGGRALPPCYPSVPRAASIFSFRALPVWPMHAPPEQVNRAPRPALCRRVPQAIAGLCAVQERRAGWSPRAAAARRRGTGLGRAAGRGARRGARLEAVSAGPPGAAARRCPAGQPRGWRPAAGVPLVLARRALAPGPVG